MAHCGDSTAGEYALTVDTTDLATGWTEQRAVWGKGEPDVLRQLADIDQALPFPLRGMDVDNGSEFLNWHLVRHFQERPTPVAFTRARAYQKNDNAHIEQKHWTHVRQWLGYRRFAQPALVARLNDLSTTEWRRFHNGFLPSVKLRDSSAWVLPSSRCTMRRRRHTNASWRPHTSWPRPSGSCRSSSTSWIRSNCGRPLTERSGTFTS